MSAEPLLRFEALHKSFGTQRVLDGVTLEARRGETLVIIGRSGCGKSVLLRHLLGLLKPDAGRVLVEGRDLVPLDEDAMAAERARFGMVFQGAALFDSLTVEENVGFALRRMGKTAGEIREIVAQRLAEVGLPGAGPKRPAELSGGMRKRVGLARALAMDPEVLLYDEPTTGLDPVMSDAISDLIVETRARRSVTSLVVTHYMTLAYKTGDRIAMLYEGRVRVDAPPAALQASDDGVVRQFIAGRAAGPIDVRSLA